MGNGWLDEVDHINNAIRKGLFSREQMIELNALPSEERGRFNHEIILEIISLNLMTITEIRAIDAPTYKRITDYKVILLLQAFPMDFSEIIQLNTRRVKVLTAPNVLHLILASILTPEAAIALDDTMELFDEYPILKTLVFNRRLTPSKGLLAVSFVQSYPEIFDAFLNNTLSEASVWSRIPADDVLSLYSISPKLVPIQALLMCFSERRVTVLTSPNVQHLISESILTPEAAIALDDTMELFDEYPILKTLVFNRKLTPSNGLLAVPFVQRYPEIFDELLNNTLSQAQLWPCIRAYEALSLWSMFPKLVPSVQAALYHPARELPLIPKTFNQFCAVNVALSLLKVAMIKHRLAVINALQDDIRELVLQLPNPAFLQAPTSNALSQSSGYFEFCRGTIKLSCRFLQASSVDRSEPRPSQDTITGHNRYRLGLLTGAVERNTHTSHAGSLHLRGW